MTQRPIVTLIVERVEIPVGFRTKGPNNRLLIVEGIGDMVMRNGKRIVCLKMRRSDDQGLELQTYATDFEDNKWDIPAPLVGTGSGGSGAGAGAGAGSNYGNISNAGAFDGIDYSQMQRIQANHGQMGGVNNSQSLGNMGSGGSGGKGSSYGYGAGFSDSSSTISIELGTDTDVSKLEALWDNLSSKYSDSLSVYEPFYSVDTPADGQGKELFHLRVGPVETLNEGDGVCSKLGRNGVFCSVVRTQ